MSLATTLPLSRLLAAAGPGTESSPAARDAVAYRAPLATGAFHLLPLGAVRPTGWLKRQLEIQAAGLSGHLDEIWADVGPDSGWLGGKGESWERGPYYLDGLVPLAWLLDDERLKQKVMRYLDWVLDHPAANGMLGPASNLDWWPRMVILKALAQFHEATADPRVIPAMDRYFRYQLSALPEHPLRDWGRFRWQDQVLTVLWLYERTGESYLIDLARLLEKQGFDWEGFFADFKFRQKVTEDVLKLGQGEGLKDLALSTHGVNNGQALKTGPVWSLVSDRGEDRAALGKMLGELDHWHGQPSGMFSCDEHLAGPDPSQGTELCTVVETMFSLEQALAILGDATLGDRLEKIAYNALPGTFDDAMWAHQYNQEANQVECSLHRKPWVSDGPESNLYGLEPNFGCCTANFHQGWPKLTTSLWMTEAGERPGLAAAVYAPSTVRTHLNGAAVEIREVTDYPFRGAIHFEVNPAAPTRFTLKLRIPAWTEGKARILVNGKAESSPGAQSWVAIEREWRPGDQVLLELPMQPRVRRGFHHSVSIERGPLVFSYGIEEDWVKLRERGPASDWQVFPRNSWNYALAVDPDHAATAIAVTESEVGAVPFARSHAAVKLSVKARKLDAWVAEDGVALAVPESPVKSPAPEETLTLIPYGAAKLRITAFPVLGS